MHYPEKIDLHMHTTVSDGTDTPEEILANVKEAGIELFSVTDHDAVKAGPMIRDLLKEGDPLFLTGAEFSCKDEEGKYHILGYLIRIPKPSASSLILGMATAWTRSMQGLIFSGMNSTLFFPRRN